MFSRRTDTLSKLSVRFEFDGLVFASRVYEKVFRSTVKDGLRRPNRRLYTEEGSLPWVPVPQNRKETDQTLKQHTPKSSLELVRKVNERVDGIIRVQEPRHDPHRKRAAAILLSREGATDTLNRVPTLAKDCVLDRIPMEKAHILLTGADHIGVQYIKTCFDDALGNVFEIDRFSRLSTTLRTFLSNNSRCLLHVIHQNDMCLERVPGSPSLIVFCVDLSHYEQPFGFTRTKLHKSMIDFRQIMSRITYETSHVLLLLRSHEGFSVQLKNSPLQRFFLDFDGGPDKEKAVAYIRNRFLDPSFIRNPERVTTYFLNKLEPSSADKIVDVEAFAKIL